MLRGNKNGVVRFVGYFVEFVERGIFVRFYWFYEFYIDEVV